MIAVLAPVAGVALGSAIGDVKDCSDTASLTVMAAPEIAPTLAAQAADWSGTAVNGLCVTVEVTAVDSASVADAFATATATPVDVGDAEITPVELPDVWVPESLTWPVRLAGTGSFADRIESVAESPVGLAVTPAQADGPDAISLAEHPVPSADPRSDAAALLVLMSDAHNHRTDAPDGVGDVPVMSQAAVSAHNREHPDDRLVFLDARPSLPRFEYPYVTMRDASADRARAADAFRSSLLTAAFVDRLTMDGFIEAGPYPQPPDIELIEQAIEARPQN